MSPFDDWWDWWEQQDETAPIRRMVSGFVLSQPETELIVLLLAAESSEPVARLLARAIAEAGGVAGGGLPFWLGCRAIADLGPAALASSGPLTRLGVVDAGVGVPRIESRLRLSGSVLDRLLGEPVRDPRIDARMSLVRDALEVDAAESSRVLMAAQLSTALTERDSSGLPPLVLAAGADVDELAQALRANGLAPWEMPASAIPDDRDELARLAREWSREAALDGRALIVHSTAPGQLLEAFLDRVLGHVLLVSSFAPTALQRGMRVLVEEPDNPATMRSRWIRALGPEGSRRVGCGVGAVASHFRLDDAALVRAVEAARLEVGAATDERTAARALWHAAARAVTPAPRPGVRVVEPAYTWDDLVLPPDTEAALRRLETHVRHASRVLDDWGFATRLGGRSSWRGRGVAALFAGPSGTGKTMAAEAITASLDLRVMEIDLSQVIDKFVGQTSKNVAAVFDEAERSGAVMVWNEGDAVWGARGGVGNAVDRHVNAEVGDLLQRIETFSGFTLVTTNLRSAIDSAFLRRFRFIVDFPMPSEAERLRLWRSAFPAEVPVGEVEWERLAGLPLTGGSIRNVALGAAFIAAAEDTAVDRAIIEAELGREMRKHNLPMPRVAWAERS
ncbi:ATP-binding protein [Agromyces sp. NPDC056379]|uniref:ATP-binding protein n=1 Tax=unclassified Agromyces TaxID=2639701 RepID=UPI0035E36823